ncbi:uncharacterized protein LOC135375496 [Ornithodoros turicata]|uniref:uncharacterized protein LOC135375496 n=1 Tax=Ornithodoros turicata TaxID=34597 RepID=UPI0031390301
MPGEVSLNETLHAGPNLNPDVLDLLMQFRAHEIVLTADPEKAFLQIALDACDRTHYAFSGMRLTPKASQPFPRVETLRMPREASLLYRQARDILLEAGMKLVKRTSNDMKLRTLFQDEGTASTSTTPLRKVLGLNWDIDSDEIQLSVKSLTEFLERQVDTKRYVLQAVSRIYNALGYVAPYVITPKILLQRIWLTKLQWDDQLPEALMDTWHRWCQEVPTLSDFRVPRRLSGVSAPLQESTQSLYVFSDANTKAYGAAVYLVLQSDDGNIEISLVLAKTRVAALGTLSLPRLELMAAVLASRLVKFVRTKLSLVHVKTILWTDSTIDLYWIHGFPMGSKPFVQNRVTEIRTTT